MNRMKKETTEILTTRSPDPRTFKQYAAWLKENRERWQELNASYPPDPPGAEHYRGIITVFLRR